MLIAKKKKKKAKTLLSLSKAVIYSLQSIYHEFVNT